MYAHRPCTALLAAPTIHVYVILQSVFVNHFARVVNKASEEFQFFLPFLRELSSNHLCKISSQIIECKIFLPVISLKWTLYNYLLYGDTIKFCKINRNPINNLKIEVNKLIPQVDKQNHDKTFKPVTWILPWVIYGTVKVGYTTIYMFNLLYM